VDGAAAPLARHSYGLGRAEVFAALVNAVTMLVIAVPSRRGAGAVAVAAAGQGRRRSAHRGRGLVMNSRHPAAAESAPPRPTRGRRCCTWWARIAAALVAGLVIALSDGCPDAPRPAAIGLLVAVSALRPHARKPPRAMEAPRSFRRIGLEMARVEGVLSVHDLHVWTLSGSRSALSAHVVVGSMREWDRILGALQRCLHEKYGIDHVTLQPESDARPLVRY
jgi:cobalt-zinc-cadmium efflux system protein